MLRQIVLVNSEIYGKVELVLDNADSIQLVGENNVGKSSLINTLNLLYMIDQRQMQFEGGRSLKASLNHYFPSVQTSYLLFEFEGHGADNRYSILVQRTADHRLVYHYIDGGYQTDWFVKKAPDGQETVRQKTDFFENLKRPYHKIEQSKELYHYIYSARADQAPAVHLTPQAQYRGDSNSNYFSKIYKYLIRSTRVSSEDLIDALLIAFHRKGTPPLTFSDQKHGQLDRLLKKHQHITQLQQIEPAFIKLKRQYKRQKQHEKSAQASYALFSSGWQLLGEKTLKRVKQLLKAQMKNKGIQAALQKEVDLLNRTLGSWEGIQRSHEDAHKEYTDQLQRIADYRTPMQQTALQKKIEALTLDKQRFSKLKGDLKKKKLLDDMAHYRTSIAQITAQIKEYDHLLAHHIGATPQIRQQIHRVLSSDILSLPKSALTKQLTQSIGQHLAVLGGEIDLSQLPAAKPFKSLDRLKEKLQKNKEALALAETFLKDQTAYEKTAAKLQETLQLWEYVQRGNNLSDRLEKTNQLIQEAQKNQQTIRKNLAQKEAAQLAQSQQQATLDKEINALKQQMERQQQRLTNLEMSGMAAAAPSKVDPHLTMEGLDGIYSTLQKALNAAKKAHKETLHLFTPLRKQMRSLDDLEPFIEKTGAELDGLSELIKAQRGMLEGVQQSLIQPTRTLLQVFAAFQKEVAYLGGQLSASKVSDIHQFELHLEAHADLLSELQKISAIVPEGQLDFYNSRQDGLPILQRYIQARRTIYLTDLFRLKVRIKRTPDAAPIDLDTNKQMQSYGTDKVLRLLIFLHILQRLLDQKKSNRVVIYIDEVGSVSKENIQKILVACKRAHVLPIFAAPKFIEGFEKYYSLIPSPKNKGKIFLDEGKSVRYTLSN